MNTTMQIESMISHRLRKLAQAGLSPEEMATQMQQLMQQERQNKLASLEDQQEFMLPLVGRRRTYLNVV